MNPDELMVPVVAKMVAALKPPPEDESLVRTAENLAAMIDAMSVSAMAAILPQASREMQRALKELDRRARRRLAWEVRATRTCAHCGKSSLGGVGYKYCSESCRTAARRARYRRRDHVKRTVVSDITAQQEDAMRRRARKCPECGKWMTNKPHLPNSKELDHIVPINQGGTHTHGNVRIICRQCNQRRPKDGSDYLGAITLWAQGEPPVSRPDGRRRRAVAAGACQGPAG